LVWKTLCFHHISCSCLLLYEYKFGYDYDRCGSSKYQFFTPSLTAFPHTDGDGRKEFSFFAPYYKLLLFVNLPHCA
jgi:hypothetical protein